ncbi:hypothetical protein MK489_04250 [Myxococcota bacterium]|nr:hypothetical protein [Myxococcota bacterium]
MQKSVGDCRSRSSSWIWALAFTWMLAITEGAGAREIESRGRIARFAAPVERALDHGVEACSASSPNGASVSWEGWQYIPILGDGEVQSIVVLANRRELRDDNIGSMWFIREGESWSGYSWGAADQKEVLEDVKDTLGLSRETDSRWPVDPESLPDGRGDIATREPFETGLLSNDPFLRLVQSQPDPTKLLKALVDAGWQAAHADLFTSKCRRDQLLDGLADGFERQQEDLWVGFDLIDESIDSKLCGGGGPGKIQCDEHIVDSGPFGRSCTGTFGPGTPGTRPVTGGCITVNTYTATVTETEQRCQRKIYTDCTSCRVCQTRTRTGQTRLTEMDTNATCPPPAGYTSPPASRSPCSMANIDWGDWGPWTPPGPGKPGSPCP